MRNKLTAAYLSLAAFVAFAVMPFTALATNDPDLTEGGTLVSAGAEIIGTNVGELLWTTSSGDILFRCTTGTMAVTLTANTGTTVAGNITSVIVGGTGETAPSAPDSECTSSFGNFTYTMNPITNGLPWCLHSDNLNDATDAFRIRGGKCSEESRAIRFVLDSTTVGECAYQRTAAIPGTYTTGGTAAELSISKIEFPKVSGSFLCPGTGYLDMTFSLETSNGTALTIS